MQKTCLFLTVPLLIYSSLLSCSAPPVSLPVDAPVASTEEITNRLSTEEIATLNSLAQVDDYPLYTMHYYGDYHAISQSARLSLDEIKLPTQWACSLFVTAADPGNILYGRNFDWRFSPALLLFTAPSDGYASVSMVDIEYFGFDETNAYSLAQTPLKQRIPLLEAPNMPFDGMNEKGLVVGMAAVPDGHVKPDPGKPTIDSILLIREILDHASSIDEAKDIIQKYNVDMGSGPSIHYLIADVSGRAVLTEFTHGKLVFIPNSEKWHIATNFLRYDAGTHPEGQCWRYDKISTRFAGGSGLITLQDAMALLSEVAQDQTQWSVVYHVNTGNINVAMGRHYERIHEFCLNHLTGEN